MDSHSSLFPFVCPVQGAICHPPSFMSSSSATPLFYIPITLSWYWVVWCCCGLFACLFDWPVWVFDLAYRSVSEVGVDLLLQILALLHKSVLEKHSCWKVVVGPPVFREELADQCWSFFQFPLENVDLVQEQDDRGLIKQLVVHDWVEQCQRILQSVHPWVILTGLIVWGQCCHKNNGVHIVEIWSMQEKQRKRCQYDERKCSFLIRLLR